MYVYIAQVESIQIMSKNLYINGHRYVSIICILIVTIRFSFNIVKVIVILTEELMQFNTQNHETRANTVYYILYLHLLYTVFALVSWF
jgi:hypothetical protein